MQILSYQLWTRVENLLSSVKVDLEDVSYGAVVHKTPRALFRLDSTSPRENESVRRYYVSLPDLRCIMHRLACRVLCQIPNARKNRRMDRVRANQSL